MLKIAAAAYIALASSQASASVIYQFIDNDLPGVVMAEIELAQLPAEFVDVLAFHFTEAGNERFHLGTGNITFGRFFPLWGSRILDDGNGGLMGSAPYYDPGEVLTVLDDGPDGLYTAFYGIGLDGITQEPGAHAFGNYVLKPVPETSTVALLALGLAGLAVRSRVGRVGARLN
jgi:hypothetical protein